MEVQYILWLNKKHLNELVKKKEVLSLVNDYFKVNPCRSEKIMRINMVNKFYELRNLHVHKASPNSVLGKA
jgi:hypothetical protein